MSCGTTIYPKIEDFKEYSNLSLEELAACVDSETRYMANKFNLFRALALATPRNLFDKDAYNQISSLVADYFDDYIESYRECFISNIVSALKEDSEENPCYYFYDIEAKSKEYVLEAIKEANINLFRVKSKILGLCLATPIDITPRDQPQYVDGHYDPISYLDIELNYLEEAMDSYLHEICANEMIIKYWDGHKQN